MSVGNRRGKKATLTGGAGFEIIESNDCDAGRYEHEKDMIGSMCAYPGPIVIKSQIFMPFSSFRPIQRQAPALAWSSCTSGISSLAAGSSFCARIDSSIVIKDF